jgi:serine/threonine-protein kinase
MRGVAAAHARRVVHRDLKPDNIFLCRTAHGALHDVKVLDFGVSKLLVDDPLYPGLTQSGTLLGTPYYMSPEQVRGLRDLDARVDVYAFGVILYEALTGRLPFKADSYGALALEIATATPRAPRALRPDLPAALEKVVLKAMARDRNERFADVDALIHALTTAVGTGADEAGFATPDATSVRGGMRARGSRSSLVAATLLLAAAGVAAWLGLRGAAVPPPGASPEQEVAQPAALVGDRSTASTAATHERPAEKRAETEAVAPDAGLATPSAAREPIAREPATQAATVDAKPHATAVPRQRRSARSRSDRRAPTSAQVRPPQPEPEPERIPPRSSSTRTNAKVSFEDF